MHFVFVSAARCTVKCTTSSVAVDTIAETRVRKVVLDILDLGIFRGVAVRPNIAAEARQLVASEEQTIGVDSVITGTTIQAEHTPDNICRNMMHDPCCVLQWEINHRAVWPM